MRRDLWPILSPRIVRHFLPFAQAMSIRPREGSQALPNPRLANRTRSPSLRHRTLQVVSKRGWGLIDEGDPRREIAAARVGSRRTCQPARTRSAWITRPPPVPPALFA